MTGVHQGPLISTHVYPHVICNCSQASQRRRGGGGECRMEKMRKCQVDRIQWITVPAWVWEPRVDTRYFSGTLSVSQSFLHLFLREAGSEEPSISTSLALQLYTRTSFYVGARNLKSDPQAFGARTLPTRPSSPQPQMGPREILWAFAVLVCIKKL